MSQDDLQKHFTKLYHKTPYRAIDPTQPSLSAAGKTILITAGATGIGFSIAHNFAIAGATHIILLARRTQVLEKSTTELSATHPGTNFYHFTSSITDHANIRHVFSEIRSKISSHIDVRHLSEFLPLLLFIPSNKCAHVVILTWKCARSSSRAPRTPPHCPPPSIFQPRILLSASRRISSPIPISSRSSCQTPPRRSQQRKE